MVMQVFCRVKSVSFAQFEMQACCSPLHSIGSATAAEHQRKSNPAAAAACVTLCDMSPDSVVANPV
jgi:hypothetical protein